jgi:hypothetical protein
MSATDELAALLAERERLEARAEQVTVEERQAAQAVEEASAAVVEIEAAVARGEKIAPATRTAAHDRLIAARSAALAPWPERHAASRRVIGEHDV